MIILPQTRGVLHKRSIDPFIANVVFLSHFEATSGSNVVNVIENSSLTLANSAAINSTQARFGTNALNTTANVQGYAAGGTYTLGTGDWTVEGFFRATDVSTLQGIFAIGATADAGENLALNINADDLIIHRNNTNVLTASNVLVVNTWYFFQLIKASGTTKLYLDGTQVGGNYTDGNNYQPRSLWVGNDNFFHLNRAMRGYVDELRVTVGTARAPVNQTTAFPDS